MLCVFFLTRYALCAYARVAVYSACAEYAGKKKSPLHRSGLSHTNSRGLVENIETDVEQQRVCNLPFGRDERLSLHDETVIQAGP